MNAGMRHLGIVAVVLLAAACGPKSSNTMDPCKDGTGSGTGEEPEETPKAKEIVGVLGSLQEVDGVCTATLTDEESGLEQDYPTTAELCGPEHQKCLGAKVVMTLEPCDGAPECGDAHEELVTAIDMF